jgi:very-short-patch-repair endonuclease
MGWDKDGDAPPILPSPSWGGTGRKAARVGESKATTKRARELRKTLTPQEARLWMQLRVMRADGFHFRRQAPLLGFYLDFVCFKHRLIVEIDGSQHADDVRQIDHDAMRDAILQRAGFRTLRLWNSDVSDNLDGVVQTIQLALQNPPSPSWGGTAGAQHRQGGGVGRDNDRSLGQRTASDSPTLTASRSVPPHEGEGGKGGGER